MRNCGNVIEKGTPRLSEETREIGIPTLIHRYYDLRCALAVVPDVLRRSKPRATGSEPDLEARLDQQLEYANAQLARLARASR